ncbi:MAG: hypothetical protein QME81_17170 [bacterium]|nr:hypothetical protein [bacterium]
MDEEDQEIIEVGAYRRGIVEELEKAHIYIEQLHKQNKELYQQNKELHQHIKALEERLAKLEAEHNAGQ